MFGNYNLGLIKNTLIFFCVRLVFNLEADLRGTTARLVIRLLFRDRRQNQSRTQNRKSS